MRGLLSADIHQQGAEVADPACTTALTAMEAHALPVLVLASVTAGAGKTTLACAIETALRCATRATPAPATLTTTAPESSRAAAAHPSAFPTAPAAPMQAAQTQRQNICRRNRCATRRAARQDVPTRGTRGCSLTCAQSCLLYGQGNARPHCHPPENIGRMQV